MIYLTNNSSNKFPIVYPILAISTVPLYCGNAEATGDEQIDCQYAGSLAKNEIDCGWAYSINGSTMITISFYHIVTRKKTELVAIPIDYTKNDVTLYVSLPLDSFVGDYECMITDVNDRTYFKGLVRLGEAKYRGDNYNNDVTYKQYERQ